MLTPVRPHSKLFDTIDQIISIFYITKIPAKAVRLSLQDNKHLLNLIKIEKKTKGLCRVLISISFKLENQSVQISSQEV